MEKAFYSASANPDLRDIHAPAIDESGDFDIEAFVTKLKSVPPEKLAVLAELLKS